MDLFAGCGGLSLGLSQAGLKGVFAIERDRMAFDTFSSNLVSEISPRGYRFDWPGWLEQKAWGIDDLLDEHNGNLAQLSCHLDILAGGPPCQGFSFAGRRMEDDPRNLLFNKYVEAVALLKPSALILENVPGMRIAHRSAAVVDLFGQPQPQKQSFYQRLADSLDAVGYDVEARLLDASSFGVPQKRSRLIAIGIRKDVARSLEGGAGRAFEWIETARQDQLRDLHLSDGVTAREAISDLEVGGRPLAICHDAESPKGFYEALPRPPSSVYQKLMREGSNDTPNSMRLARHGDEVRDRFARILAECRKGVRMNDEDRREYGLKKHRIYPMAPDDPAPTITTLPDDVLHYSEPRILTVRESARLQSFPDWFKFRGKYTTGGDRRTRECPRYTQVGNAVPPYLARAIGVAIRATLDEAELNSRIFGSQEPHAAAAAG
ncbi:DNA cytosine methyltransferase [Mesorhizobium tianshanense]|uniref:DNA cytosine methyltransferase n=1 Tax=Mesorhizobium tianshanense TaxID=39844 RepID=UPI0024E13987|nr:DNA cytosine methyltransferase [Mesorhizobium tianshanense]